MRERKTVASDGWRGGTKKEDFTLSEWLSFSLPYPLFCKEWRKRVEARRGIEREKKTPLFSATRRETVLYLFCVYQPRSWESLPGIASLLSLCAIYVRRQGDAAGWVGGSSHEVAIACHGRGKRKGHFPEEEEKPSSEKKGNLDPRRP